MHKKRVVLLSIGGLALGGLLWLAGQVQGALQVAVGYSAKQLCSGVFVSRLPAEFVVTRDVLPRMALLGPARELLDLQLDARRGEARATLLTANAVAGYQGEVGGCSLHRSAQAVPAPAPPDTGPRSPFVSARSSGLMAALDRAFVEPVDGGRQTLAVVVARRGEIVAERYAAPVTAATPLQGWSMNKSLMATWVGMGVESGTLALDLPVAAHLRELGAPAAVVEPVSANLTLDHLLRMRSGFAFEERYGPGSDVTRMLYRERHMWQLPPSLGQAHPPGVHFSYSSGDTVLLSYLWQSALPVEDYTEWLTAEFAMPLGLSSLVAEADASGVQVGSSYAYLRARDWLAVGQLWLDAWHGRSEVLSREWQRAAIAPPTDGSGDDYGRGFWLNSRGLSFPDLPTSLFYAGGNAGQYVVVLPEQELVVVRLGLSDADADTGIQQLLRDVLASAR
jgi:CubicO group peptidase (beta-lactamase class C family)